MQDTREGDDDRMRFLEIDLIGGPYDGHKQPCFRPPGQLPADVVWLVCEGVVYGRQTVVSTRMPRSGDDGYR